MCFSGGSEKQNSRPGPWLAETFSTFSLKPLNGIQKNLTGTKISTSSTEFLIFGPIGKNKMAPLASDLLRHFWLLLWNCWIEFNETWQEARSQCSLPSVFFGPYWKIKWPPWPLICLDMFDFSETAEWNSTKLDRKQDFNVLCQVCVFPVDRTNKMAALASDSLRHFLLWNPWMEFNETWQEFVFFGPIGKQDGHPGQILWFLTSPLNYWMEFNES